jgi:hypothetical protein
MLSKRRHNSQCRPVGQEQKGMGRDQRQKSPGSEPRDVGIE